MSRVESRLIFAPETRGDFVQLLILFCHRDFSVPSAHRYLVCSTVYPAASQLAVFSARVADARKQKPR